jgi:hypothetical protein
MQEIPKILIISVGAGVVGGVAMVILHKTLHPQKQHPIVSYVSGTVVWLALAAAVALYCGMDWHFLIPFVVILALSGLATMVSYLVDRKGLEKVISKVNEK